MSGLTILLLKVIVPRPEISTDSFFDNASLITSDCLSKIKLISFDLLPTSRTKVMEQSPLISENSGYETIQIYR